MAFLRIPGRTSQAPPEVGARSPARRPEALTDALEHLLEPLEFPPEHEFDPRAGPVWDDAVDPGGLGHGLHEFGHRLRWSRRLRYRVPRLLVLWISLIVPVVAFGWLLLGVMRSP